MATQSNENANTDVTIARRLQVVNFMKAWIDGNNYVYSQ